MDPLITNNLITIFSFMGRFTIFPSTHHNNMFISEIYIYIFICVLLKTFCPMEITCVFMAFHLLSIVIHNPHCIAIGNCCICHETCKFHFLHFVLFAYGIEFCPKQSLGFLILHLHVTHCQCHHFSIQWIINMGCKCCPSSMRFMWSKQT